MIMKDYAVKGLNALEGLSKLKTTINSIKYYLAEFIISCGKFLMSLSDRTLELSVIAILNVVFLPNYMAYLNRLTDKLPNLDTYILVLLVLAIMNLRSIIKKDSAAILIHMIGFISQLVIFTFIVLK